MQYVLYVDVDVLVYLYMYMCHLCVIRCNVFMSVLLILLGRRLWGLPWLAGDCANRASKGVKRRVEEVMDDLYPRTMQELHALCDAKQVCYLSLSLPLFLSICESI